MARLLREMGVRDPGTARSGTDRAAPALARRVPPAALIDRQIYDAFGNGRLQSHLDARKVDRLIVSGGETDLCVLATVLAAIDIGYRVIIVEDALCIGSEP